MERGDVVVILDDEDADRRGVRHGRSSRCRSRADDERADDDSADADTDAGQPGPLLFTKNSELVWTLLASLFVGLVVLLVLNLGLAGLWVKLLEIPKPYLYAGITILSVLGVYAASSSIVDLAVLLGIGLIGLLMRKARVPLAPVMIAVVLGPLAETELRRALVVSEGDVGTLVESPFTIALYTILALGLVVSLVQHLRHRRAGSAASATPDDGVDPEADDALPLEREEAPVDVGGAHRG